MEYFASSENPCLVFVDRSVHVYETLLWIGLSVVFIYSLRLVNIFSNWKKIGSLVVDDIKKNLACYKREIERLRWIPRIIMILLFADVLHFAYYNGAIFLFSPFRLHSLSLLLELLVYFLPIRIGFPFAIVIIEFIACSLIKSLYMLVFSFDLFLCLQFAIIYGVMPYLLMIKYNFPLRYLGMTNYLGFWLFTQVHWSGYEVIIFFLYYPLFVVVVIL